METTLNRPSLADSCYCRVIASFTVVLSVLYGLLLWHNKIPSEESIRTGLCSNSQNMIHQDVIIVGGGPGGTFAGWKLKSNSSWQNKSVLLLEATARLGGRLYSVKLPGVEHSVAELGGMRFAQKLHKRLYKLTQELGLVTHPFPMQYNGPLYLRNVFLPQSDQVGGELPYNVKDDEKNMTATDLLKLYLFERAIPKSEQAKPIFDMMTNYGYPLYYYGWRNLLQFANASQEATFFITDSSGFSSLQNNPSSVFAFVFELNETSSPQNKILSIADGMDKVPQKLGAEFLEKGGRILLNTTVVSIKSIHDSTDNSKFVQVTTKDSVTGEMNSYCANDVIMSLTRSQLQRIDWHSLHANSPLVNSVDSFKVSKLFLVFDEPWWKDSSFQALNLTSGPSISSLPSGQTYFSSPPSPSDSSKSFSFFYNDAKNVNFWSAMSNDKMEAFPGPKSPYPLTKPMVEEAIYQLAINHNTSINKIGTPTSGVFMAWDHEKAPHFIEGYGPYMPSKTIRCYSSSTSSFLIGEGWHMWQPGFNYSQISDVMVQLNSSENVFICGEAYAAHQGWVESALETADNVLTRFFDQEHF
eukprot:m.179141 g.179141  ORF g.179141 m.179141 type:complete len:583 (+) comp39208_c0_seq7:120-1868(+)